MSQQSMNPYGFLHAPAEPIVSYALHIFIHSTHEWWARTRRFGDRFEVLRAGLPHLCPPPLAFVKAKMAVQKKRMGRASALHDMRLKIMQVISLETHLYRCMVLDRTFWKLHRFFNLAKARRTRSYDCLKLLKIDICGWGPVAAVSCGEPVRAREPHLLAFAPGLSPSILQVAGGGASAIAGGVCETAEAKINAQVVQQAFQHHLDVLAPRSLSCKCEMVCGLPPDDCLPPPMLRSDHTAILTVLANVTHAVALRCPVGP
jgi:hypothetical protein